MAHFTTRFRLKRGAWRGPLAVAFVCLAGSAHVFAQAPTPPPAAPPPAAPPSAAPPPAAAPATLPPEQLDSLVAPIALYPDPVLAQALAASTYPLEIIQLQQWLTRNPNLKDKALADAVAQQPWDPSIQSLAAIPALTKRLADDIQWTTDLGNAFLAQQSEVMDAVQRMRKKAQAKGALASNEQQRVETTIVETKEVIIVQPATPEVVYVPVYSPTVVYGPPVYPYPPVYYPPYTPGAAFVTFGVGVMVGAAIWGGTCCGCGWGGHGHGHGHVTVNNVNNFNRNTNRNTNVNRSGNGNWQHNAEHRGGAPYSDRATATKYGGSARGDSAGNRQQRAGGPSASNPMPSTRPSGNNSSTRAGVSDRSAGGNRDSGNRGTSAGSSNRSGGSGGDRIGSREIGGSNTSSRGGGGFGSSSGFSGDSARANSSRGASSAGGRGGGRGGGRR